MFVDCRFHNYFQSYNCEEFEVIDTEFSCYITIPGFPEIGANILLLSTEIAKEYEKRNLNAAANLALFYKKLMGKQYFDCDINVLIKDHYKFNPKLSKEFYDKYLLDIKKYMLLL